MKKIVITVLLVAFAVLSLASCVPSEPADARVRFRARGYDVDIMEKNYDIEDELEYFDVYTDGVDAVVRAWDSPEDINSKFAFAYVIYCEDRKTARYVALDCEAYVENDLEDALERNGARYDVEDFCVMKKGKIVLFGLKKMLSAVS